MISFILNAKNIHINKNYKLTYEGVLDLAELNVTIAIKNNKYTIKSISKAIGMIGAFNTKITQYISRGKYIKKHFMPYIFIKKVTNRDERRVTEVYFNHRTKITTGTNKVFKLEDNYFAIVKKTDINISKGMQNDIVTLLFNLPYYSNKYKVGDEVKIRAVDASKEDGYFHIKLPNKKETTIAKKQLNTNIEKIIIIYIDEPIFDTDRGELILAIEEDGVFTKALLKNVSFFGDILLEEVQQTNNN